MEDVCSKARRIHQQAIKGYGQKQNNEYGTDSADGSRARRLGTCRLICSGIYKHTGKHIKGEGNCFYRAVIFTFLENIVITNNLYLLKEFAIDFYEKFKKFQDFRLCHPFR